MYLCHSSGIDRDFAFACSIILCPEFFANFLLFLICLRALSLDFLLNAFFFSFVRSGNFYENEILKVN